MEIVAYILAVRETFGIFLPNSLFRKAKRGKLVFNAIMYWTLSQISIHIILQESKSLGD